MIWRARLPLSLLVAFLCLLVGASRALATTWYVEKTATCAGCTDANTCLQAQTITTGKATVNAALACMVTAGGGGHAVEVGNGSYNEYIRTATTGCPAGYTCTAFPSGTGTGARNVLKAKAGHTPELKPTAVAPAGTGAIVNFNKTTSSQFIDIGAIGAGFILDASTCSGSPGTTAACGGVSIGASGATTNNIRILGNTIRFGHVTDSAAGVVITQSAHTNTIGGNTLFQNGRDSLSSGLQVLTNANVIEDNVISQSGASNLLLYKPTSFTWLLQDNIVRRNTLHTNGVHSTTSSNLRVGGDTNSVYANVLHTSEYSALKVKYGSPTGNKLYNNTICGSTGEGISIDADATTTDVQNNIIYNAVTGYVNGGTGTIFTTNLGCPQCNNTANPLFVGTCTNLHLQTGSPAINTGANLTATVALDRDGTTYNVPMEIGAHTFGTVVPPLVLVFTSAPVGAVEGTTMAIVRAEIRDSAGTLQTSHANNCVIAKASGPGTLSGTTNVAPSSGVCTWSNLSLSQDGTYTLSVTSTGVTSVTSGSFVITDAAAAPTGARLHRTGP